MTSNEFLVNAKGIHAWYASSHVLHGIDFKIARGQTMGLLRSEERRVGKEC